ncbi:MAG TPA: hypothetical protein VG603_15650 [Chitinophagales bacterium]|nr:hypothetical protein [Chitinophagales bacterium]
MDGYSIYPKQFRNAKIPIEKNRCFILMPFQEQFDGIYGHLKKALNDNGYVCNRADEILGSKPIMNKILNEILKSHYIIADLTNQNANVFYELGIAHTFKDAQNIILITQKLEDIPFDIRHINNIIYNKENIKYLTSGVIQTLKDNNYLLGFYEALQQRNIIRLINDNKEEFIDYLRSSLDGQVQIATNILLNQLGDYEESSFEQFFDAIINIIDTTIKAGNYSFLGGIMKFFFECITTCSKYKITDKIVNDILYGNLLTTYNINPKELVSYQIDLAILLTLDRAKLAIAMNWIINYFSASKSATIDLNRYKVERFLMTTNDKLIDSIIVDALFHESCYIREHLSDIIGEKKLYEAGESLNRQLAVEDNFFSAMSMIAAIGKLERQDGAIAILEWIKDKQDEIIKTKQFFVLKHSYIALSRLDRKHGTDFTPAFDKKYGKYIKNYTIV